MPGAVPVGTAGLDSNWVMVVEPTITTVSVPDTYDKNSFSAPAADHRVQHHAPFRVTARL